MMLAASVWGVGAACAARRAERTPEENWLDGASVSGLDATLEVAPAADRGQVLPGEVGAKTGAGKDTAGQRLHLLEEGSD
jgi:hypothetical protein